MVQATVLVQAKEDDTTLAFASAVEGSDDVPCSTKRPKKQSQAAVSACNHQPAFSVQYIPHSVFKYIKCLNENSGGGAGGG